MMDGWMGGCNICFEDCYDGWMDGWMGGCNARCKDCYGWMDGWVYWLFRGLLWMDGWVGVMAVLRIAI